MNTPLPLASKSKSKRTAIRSVGGPLATIAAAAAGYESGIQVYDRLRTAWTNKFAYTVTVTDNDPIYTDVQVWLLSLIPEESHRALMVGTRRNHATDDTPTEPTTINAALRVTYNETRPRTIIIDGEPVTIDLSRPEVKSTSEAMSKYGEPEKIVFTCRHKAGQAAVIRHLKAIHAARHELRKPRLMMVGSWGGWTSRDDLPTRPLESVVLPAVQKARIRDDLHEFLNSESTYIDLAIPWHRGYLFHGPPGTGKTSLVKALACEFNLDLWYISLSDLKSESSLLDLISGVEPRSLLLVEDIDTVRITHDRDTDQGAISMSSLLNALDGVATPHGLITVMTTNHIDQLDPALTRAGRMDRIEEIGAPTWVEVAELFTRFYNRPFTATTEIQPPAMAVVAECFKRNLDDPDAAYAELHQKVTGAHATCWTTGAYPCTTCGFGTTSL